MIGILGMILILAGIRTRSLSYVTCAAIFGIYLLFLIHKTFFPLYISGSYADIMKASPFMVGVNLIPFKFNNASDLYSVVRELALNLVLLMPFGFGIRFLVSFRTKDVFWLVIAVGCSIEAIQLVISLIIGYPYRVIDITDAIMNTLGFLVGYGFFRLFSGLYLAITHRLKIQPIGLGKYIYTIAHRATDQQNSGDPHFDGEVIKTP
jgi:glycopeptide antibiotics resistance protein